MNEFLKTYRNQLPLYETFSTRLESLLIEIIKSDNVKVHFTEARAKKVSSVEDKLLRPDKKYQNPAKEIPDLIGIRLVLYYQDDIEKVEKIINKEFDVLEEEKNHQADKYSPDKFGYLSVHYVVKLNKLRANLSEWKAVSHLHAEIQIRTVLQHSWAAISHALQYKREGDVAPQLRRKLFRLAGLFELADEQFIEIRDERSLINEQSQNDVKNNKQDAPLNTTIVKELIYSSKRFLDLIESVKKLGAKLDDEDDQELEYIGVVTEELERLNVNTIKDFNKLINQDFSKFFTNLELNGWFVSSGFILYLLLIQQYSDKFDANYLFEENGWSKSTAEEVIKAVERSKA
jgi:ppGpp synthetase/RelA/SpoT-type nucleotidyltranferase